VYVPAPPAPSTEPVSLAAIVVNQSPIDTPVPVAGPQPIEARPAPADTTLSVRRTDLNVLAGQVATIAGTLEALRPASRLADRMVALQVRGRHGWLTLAGTHTGRRGRYRLRYRPESIGSEAVRVRFAGDVEDRGARRALGRLNVYRLAGASWYGGGGSLACGGWLTSSTLGVANKTLPCGTLVTLRYGGRTVRVPVIDRGPYVAGREYDLTEATKRALGFEGAGEVWATS
jgi:rare lipoprotein A